MIKKSIIVVVTLTMVLFAVSCSAEASEPTMQELYKAAKAEGKVIWQHMGGIDEVKGLTDAFQAKYPEIKLTVFSFAAGGTATRIIGEAAANKLTFDIANMRQFQITPLVERDLLVKYDWTKIGVSQDDIAMDRCGVIVFDDPMVWVRNTNVVSEAEAPKTWEDVLDPKWKGYKITMRASASALTPLYLTWKEDKQKAIDYISRFKKQEIVVAKRGTEVVSRMASGECPIGRTSITAVFAALREKAPLAILPISPTADFGGVVCIPKGAPHPNAAKFFIAWLKGPEAKNEWEKIGYGRAYPPDASSLARTLAKNGIKYVPINSKEDIVEFENIFAKKAVEIMGLQPGAD